MLLKVKLGALREGRWSEYAIRFALGGLATVMAGAVSAWAGPSIGGLFLAFPAIFCASATLVESHERRRKQRAGLSGQRRGEKAAALDAAGATLGSLGLLAFALVFSVLVTSNAPAAFIVASATWAIVAVAAWWCRRVLRRP